ncbi:MAG: MFS transporter permease [Pseudomonadota bacterium]
MAEGHKTQIVPKEAAIFWMDGEGRWHNAHGPFENPKISAYFHSCIDRDADGFFLRQERDGILEKVYFSAADTALFVFRVDIGEAVSLTLNTGRTLRLDPAALFIRNDRLYLTTEDGRIKFSESATMKLAQYLDEDAEGMVFNFGGVKTPVREE